MSEQFERCPVCDSPDIESGDFERWEDKLFLERECEDCYVKWFEIYEFMHNENEFGDILFD